MLFSLHLLTLYGSLIPCFLGYLKFGINTVDGATIYREWAPAAQ